MAQVYIYLRMATFIKDSLKMEIGRDKVLILGLIKAIIKVNGLLIKWMEKEYMLTLRFSFRVILKMTILLDLCTDILINLYLINSTVALYNISFIFLIYHCINNLNLRSKRNCRQHYHIFSYHNSQFRMQQEVGTMRLSRIFYKSVEPTIFEQHIF